MRRNTSDPLHYRLCTELPLFQRSLISLFKKQEWVDKTKIHGYSKQATWQERRSSPAFVQALQASSCLSFPPGSPGKEKETLKIIFDISGNFYAIPCFASPPHDWPPALEAPSHPWEMCATVGGDLPEMVSLIQWIHDVWIMQHNWGILSNQL